MRQWPAHLSEEDLVLLASGELAPGPAAEAAAHLETCGDCRDSLREIRSALEGYAEARSVALDARIPPGGASRAEMQRRLREARPLPAPGAMRLAFRPGKLHWTLGLAVFLIVVAMATVRSLHQPETARVEIANDRFAPDSRLTPGLTAAISRAELCAVESDGLPAAIDAALAIEVFRVYGIANPRPRAYEVDFLIPPELGGAKDVRNLWPQPYDVHPWNAHAKDALEDFLRRAVCDGRLTLEAAQADLAGGWIDAYRKHFRTPEPLIEHASFLKDEPWE